MTTEIISLVLLVLMVIVMYFVMKIYSILRAHECSFHPVHDIEMDAATKRTELHGGVAPRQRRTLTWMAEKYENTSRVPGANYRYPGTTGFQRLFFSYLIFRHRYFENKSKDLLEPVLIWRNITTKQDS